MPVGTYSGGDFTYTTTSSTTYSPRMINVSYEHWLHEVREVMKMNPRARLRTDHHGDFQLVYPKTGNIVELPRKPR